MHLKSIFSGSTESTLVSVIKVLFVFGTRPEAIKLCPVIRRLRVGCDAPPVRRGEQLTAEMLPQLSLNVDDVLG